jgi:hypothetical protein
MEIVRFSTVPHLAHDGPLSASWLGEERTLLRRILTTFGPGLLMIQFHSHLRHWSRILVIKWLSNFSNV